MPLLMVGGIFGNILGDIPIVMICVLIASLLECFVVLPHHLREAFRPSKPRRGKLAAIGNRLDDVRRNTGCLVYDVEHLGTGKPAHVGGAIRCHSEDEALVIVLAPNARMGLLWNNRQCKAAPNSQSAKPANLSPNLGANLEASGSRYDYRAANNQEPPPRENCGGCGLAYLVAAADCNAVNPGDGLDNPDLRRPSINPGVGMVPALNAENVASKTNRVA